MGTFSEKSEKDGEGTQNHFKLGTVKWIVDVTLEAWKSCSHILIRLSCGGESLI